MALLEKGKMAVGSEEPQLSFGGLHPHPRVESAEIFADEEGLVHVLDAESLRATGSFRPFAPGSPVHALCALPGEPRPGSELEGLSGNGPILRGSCCSGLEQLCGLRSGITDRECNQTCYKRVHGELLCTRLLPTAHVVARCS